MFRKVPASLHARPTLANSINKYYLLIENNYQENKCLHVLEEMRQCCLKWHKESLCCSGIILDKPYIQKAENEKRAELLSRY